MGTHSNEIGFGPPEVLDTIFGYVEFEDVKNCRLVCHHWRNCMQLQLDLRARMKLDSQELYMTSDQIWRSTEPGEFKNFLLVRSLPATFEQTFSPFLTSVYLKDVCFVDLNDVRRILFKSFKSMREVGLLNVGFANKPIQGAAIQVLQDEVPKVMSLRVDRLSPRRTQEDLLDVWGYEELIQQYSSSLVELHLHQKDGNGNRDGIWEALRSNEVRLKALRCSDTINRAEFEYLLAYVESTGDALRTLQLKLWSTYRIFEDYGVRLVNVLRSVKMLDLGDQNWSTWPAYDLPNLHHLCMDQRLWTSFDFLNIMPNLKIVEMRHDQSTDMQNYPGVVGRNVQKLVLKQFSGQKLTAHSQMFPNVTKLILHNVATNGLSGELIFQTILEAWPHLMHLEISGSGWSGYLASVGSVAVDGELFPVKRSLKRGTTVGLGNENPREFSFLPAFTDLISYTHNDDKSTGQVLYGDYAGIQIFGQMPSLRRVQLGNCNLSPDVQNDLKDRLMIFTYKAKNSNCYR